MAVRKTAFTNEGDLITALLARLEGDISPWMTRSCLREFDYVSGRTDVLSLSWNDEVIAFEAKLSNWHKALHQAWRNTSFANRAYVVLPRDRAAAALRHRQEFEERGAGLCLVDSVSLEVVVESVAADPVIPWLHNKARKTLIAHGYGSDRDLGKNDLPEPQLHLCTAV